MDFIIPFITVAVAAFIWCLVNMPRSGASVNRIGPSSTKEQHDQSGSWEATPGDRQAGLSEQQQSVQLVHDALDTAIQSMLTAALSHNTMNELAARMPSPTGLDLAHGNTIDFAPEVTAAIKPTVSPARVPVAAALLNLSPAPQSAATAKPGTRKCPRCGLLWQEAFTFCLHCGYTS